mmetsp:Transcript_15459/g.32533  ORF Transcript_15459/g.32533 Transcript_15459/m.32533 type:complete len:138 (-) Transcript_15459:1545-1958(-)
MNVVILYEFDLGSKWASLRKLVPLKFILTNELPFEPVICGQVSNSNSPLKASGIYLSVNLRQIIIAQKTKTLNTVKQQLLLPVAHRLLVRLVKILRQHHIPILPHCLQSCLGTNGTNIRMADLLTPVDIILQIQLIT